MSESYIYENPTGSEGLFTFNFFCESVTGALHTLIHVMEDHELEAPDSLSEIPERLAQIGIAFSEDYASHKLDLGRFKSSLFTTLPLPVTTNWHRLLSGLLKRSRIIIWSILKVLT